MKSKTLTIEIPEQIYNEAVASGIDIESTIIRALQRKIRISNGIYNLESGYKSISKINLGFAKMCLEADEAALEITEQYLTECE